jgi:segregation and condensation protein A
MSYTIKLPVFEGPFDLLLFFIERDELDIYNIPIAKVTDDFLAYWREMERLNIDMASEFIVVAATLMRIKARLLLPRKEKDEEGNEIDPRKELVDRLLEYKRYKSVLEEMQILENDRSLREKRGGVSVELQKIATKALVDVELESLTLYKLLQTYEKVLKRFDEASRVMVHTVVKYNYTIQGQKEYVFSRVYREKKCDFVSILSDCENRLHAIFTFLAILELIQLREITALIGEGANNFWLEAIEEL